jgi:hypothetical protein
MSEDKPNPLSVMLLAYGSMLSILVEHARIRDPNFVDFAKSLFDEEPGKQLVLSGQRDNLNEEARELFMKMLGNQADRTS